MFTSTPLDQESSIGITIRLSSIAASIFADTTLQFILPCLHETRFCIVATTDRVEP